MMPASILGAAILIGMPSASTWFAMSRGIASIVTPMQALGRAI